MSELLLEVMGGALDDEDCEMLAAAWEGIWLQRNLVWQGKQSLSPPQLFLQVSTNLRCFRRAQALDGRAYPNHDYQDQWEPPPPGVAKFNTDAAVIVAKQAVGVGIIIRDNRCRCLPAKTAKIHGDLDAHRAEAIATKEGLLFAWEKGFKYIILEGDARNIFESFRVMLGTYLKVLNVVKKISHIQGLFFMILSDSLLVICQISVCAELVT